MSPAGLLRRFQIDCTSWTTAMVLLSAISIPMLEEGSYDARLVGHKLMSLKELPPEVPNSDKSAIREMVENNPASHLFWCKNTGAVFQSFPKSSGIQFLVVPARWKNFRPESVTEDDLDKHGIPVSAIRELLDSPSVVMNQLKVSIKASSQRRLGR